MEVALEGLGVGEQPARPRIEREHRVGVEIVARPQLDSEVGRGIAGGDVQRARQLIEGIRRPRRSTTRRILGGRLRPRGARRTTVGDDIELPDRPAARSIERVDPSRDAELVATGIADEHEVAPGDRRHRHRLALLGITDRDVPPQFSRWRFDTEDVRIAGAAEQHAAAIGNTAIHFQKRGRLGSSEFPFLPAGGAVDRVRRVVRREVEDAGDGNDARLEADGVRCVERADLLEASDVRCLDFVEWGIALPAQRAVIKRPVAGRTRGRSGTGAPTGRASRQDWNQYRDPRDPLDHRGEPPYVSSPALVVKLVDTLS